MADGSVAVRNLRIAGSQQLAGVCSAKKSNLLQQGVRCTGFLSQDLRPCRSQAMLIPGGQPTPLGCWSAVPVLKLERAACWLAIQTLSKPDTARCSHQAGYVGLPSGACLRLPAGCNLLPYQVSDVSDKRHTLSPRMLSYRLLFHLQLPVAPHQVVL
jgi:hypothetical protein